MHDPKLVRNLEEKAKQIRKDILYILSRGGVGGVGHIPGDMSMVEIGVALYYHHMRHDPKNPNWVDRDRLVLSKAHCCVCSYAILADLGYIDKKCLNTYGDWHSPLQGHADYWSTPGIEYSGGSLGQGFSFATGMALAAMVKAPKVGLPGFEARQPKYRVYCVTGDGEINEGQVWSGALTASSYNLWNLINIVDYNKYQGTGPSTTTPGLINLEPLADKWRSFGWNVIECNGNDMGSVLDTLDFVDTMPGNKPKCIIAHTIKGKGMPALESSHAHYGPVSKEDYEKAVKELFV